jgi:ParB family chromosome partitioning protein
LGRGLNALIPQQTAQAPAGVDTVDIDLIQPNPQQPRTTFSPDKLAELAASIKEHGVLQPVIVTRTDSGLGPATYQLIAGERRLQAARMAGVTMMPVVVREATERQMLEMALIENIQREDLNPIEEASAIARLYDEYKLTQEEIATKLGRSRHTVSNSMRLLALEPDIRASLSSGQISESHARALLAIDDTGTRLDAWRRIVSDGLTVRDVEELAKQLRAVSGTAGSRKGGRPSGPADPHVAAIERDLRHALGAKVQIRKGRIGGRIVITFHNDEELEGILDRIGRG